MARFAYVAKKNPQDVIKGVLLADSKSAAIQKIARMGYYVMSLDEEDELAQRSLKNAYDTLAPGGYFILANQEGHPNLSLVQNIFEGFEHRPLRLKTRPESVIRGWLNDVGFQIEKVLKDKNSHYAVFKACK